MIILFRMSRPESTMSMRSPLIAALSFSWSSVRFYENMLPYTWHVFKSPWKSLQQDPCDIPTFWQQHFLDTGDGIITSRSKWSAFAFTNHQHYSPHFEPQIPLVDMWLGHAFLLVDISHHLYCFFSSLAQFNTKLNVCLLFKLWHFAMWQCVLIHVAFSLSCTSPCIIIPDHNVPSPCISMCGKYPTCLSVYAGSILPVL
jgi:hypothetical protein